MVRAWGLEPQHIAAREPKGDVTLVNFMSWQVAMPSSAERQKRF